MQTSQSINKRLTLLIVMFSTVVTLFITAFQLYSDFLVATDNIKVSQQYIFTSYKDALEESLWVLNNELIESQINGIISIPDISYVRIEDTTEEYWEQGVPKDKHVLEQRLSLEYSYINQKAILLGHLIIQSDLWVVYNALIDKALVILLSNGLKTFIVAGFIIYLVKTLVTEPLNQMSEYFKAYQFQRDNPPMIIQRKAANDDEIDFMVTMVNRMCNELSESYGSVLESKHQLAQALEEKQVLLEREIEFKQGLELKVKERTQELEDALNELRDTQATMVENEKMASLGSLVAGVAHEINTPLGVSITSSSFASSEINQILKDYEEGKLQERTFGDAMRNVHQSMEILSANLERAALLVASFKQVAVDQTNETVSQFNIKDHIEKLLVSLSHELRIRNVEVDFDCDDSINVTSYASAYIQIFTNLITNSLNHGFDNWEHEKRIVIDISKQQESMLIDYRDTGRGVDESVKDKIFDPFITTKQGSGGTGLGANIIYNTVCQRLKGKIQYIDEEKRGAHFVITLPLKLDNSTDNDPH